MGNGNLFFESVFKRKFSDAGTREDLANIADEHPYFSHAQFYLLLQSEKGTTEYQQLAAKTAILFNNPYWLQFQLQEKQLTELPGIEPATFPGSVPLKEEPAPAIAQIDQEPATFEAEPLAKTVVTAEELVNETALARVEEATEITTVEDSQPTDNNAIEEQETATILQENIEPLPTSATPEIEETAGDERENPLTTALNDTGKATPSHVHFNNDSEPLVNETSDEEETAAEEEIDPGTDSVPLNFKLNIDTSGTTEETISFEPLHTTDYFASLGIRLSNDITPNDKLGMQLKSFTEWLKTMKKIHREAATQQGTQTELNIQQLAEQSNKDDAVLTEAMADVLLHQGKADKAIEVYKKLSLFNPSKSAYFAAKIDQLKEH